MVGYNRNGYRLWNPKGNNTIISKDLTFDETNILFLEEMSQQNEILHKRMK